MTYYEILEVSEKASPEVIRMAYKALCKTYHPDLYQGDKNFAEEKMKQINEAYTTLSDPTKKRQYDATLNRQANYTQSSYQQPRQTSYSKSKEERQKPKFVKKLFLTSLIASPILTLLIFTLIPTIFVFPILITLTVIAAKWYRRKQGFIKKLPLILLIAFPIIPILFRFVVTFMPISDLAYFLYDAGTITLQLTPLLQIILVIIIVIQNRNRERTKKQ